MTFDRETYQREYARKKHREPIDAANMRSDKCTAMLGNQKPCKTVLESRLVDGVTVPFCPTCDRKLRGVCIECEGAVEGRSLRCPLHKKLAINDAYARYKQRNGPKLRRKERERLADPVVHADRLVYKRLYRLAMPNKIAAYKKEYAERNAAKVKAYRLAYYAQNAERCRAREAARYNGTLPDRQCLTCDTVLTGPAKRCGPCKEASRKAARADIAVRVERAA